PAIDCRRKHRAPVWRSPGSRAHHSRKDRRVCPLARRPSIRPGTQFPPLSRSRFVVCLRFIIHPMLQLKLGTRKSALAQAQANWVAQQLKASFPDLQVELILITTSGDEKPHPPPSAVRPLPSGEGTSESSPLLSGGLKALFTKEIEEALLDNRIDLAV